jgi:YD repeat-containing protein
MRYTAKLEPARFCGLLMLVVLLFGSAQAQTSNITDGTTPPAIAPGAPLGTYPITGMEVFNPFTGDLSLRFPAATLGGRGSVSYPFVLSFGGQKWSVDKSYDIITGQPIYTPTTFHWQPISFFNAPRMLARRVSSKDIICQPPGQGGPAWTYSLTRLTFTSPDGTEYELRDDKSSGAQQQSYCQDGQAKYNREKIFKTADGSAATFVATNNVYDAVNQWDSTVGITGVTWVGGDLYLKDGTQYHFKSDDGYVEWIRDRNGNKITFSYSIVSTSPFITSTAMTDQLNRKVEVLSGVTDPQYGYGTQITFKGFGGANRKIFLTEKLLGQVLRTTQMGDSSTVKSYYQLFGLNASYTNPYEPYRTSDIWLPDGRRYQLFYNEYGDVARIMFPTGGATEYDWAGGVDAYTDGVFPNGTDPFIYRRITAKRVYKTTSLSSLLNQTTYSVIPLSGWSTTPLTATVTQKDASNNTINISKHKYYTSPLWAMVQIDPLLYTPWNDGKENETQALNASGEELRKVIYNWQYSPPTNPANWWTGPLLADITTTLVDTNQVSKQVYNYDSYNNPIDVWEYDYGTGSYGTLLRHTRTQYLTTNNGVNYATDTSIHLRSLPTSVAVYSDAGTSNKLSETTYEYDNYTPDPPTNRHAELIERTNISGLCNGSTNCPNGPNFTIKTYKNRGNVTKVSRWRNVPSGTVEAFQQYDVAGNVVKVFDANGNATDFDFRDNFGSPNDGSLQSGGQPVNSAPSELSGPNQSAFAFPFKVTNALSHVAYTQYDYYLGRPVDTEDPNGVKSCVYYADALDRPTKGIHGIGTAVASQSVIVYNDSSSVVGGYPARSATIINDKDTFGESGLTTPTGIKRVALYDELGRTWRTAIYEGNTGGGNTWAITDTQFDALGRVSQVSNPYRAADPATASAPSGTWTTTVYDALNRMTTVTSPNGAVVSTSYSGNAATVTAPGNKLRRSLTDALGRMIRVDEPNASNSLGSVSSPAQPTSYTYDALGNLRRVQQDTQTRYFAYDSLSRLIYAKMPEQTTNTAFVYTDNTVSPSNSQWSIKYVYDNNGNLTERTDGRNIAITYTYDALNRSLTANYSNTSVPDITRVYDPPIAYGKGRFWYAYAGGYETPGVKEEYREISAYDALGRPLTVNQFFKASNNVWSQPFTTSQTYDLAGNVKTITYPSGRVVNYSYNTAGQLTSFTGKLGGLTGAGGADVNYATAMQYNPRSQMIRETFGTNTALYLRKHYNRRGQLFDIRLGTDSNSAWDVEDPAVWQYANGALASDMGYTSGQFGESCQPQALR